MGYFTEFESAADIFNPVSDDTDDMTTYPAIADESIPLHIIRITNTEVYVFGDEIADYVTNPTGDFTARIHKNARIEQGSKVFKAVNEPEYRQLNGTTSIELKRILNKE